MADEQVLFGPYRLESLLGRGGMGEVWRAYDTETDRIVALKLLHAELATDAGFEARFRRECRVVARLNEPHVIPIHRFGDIDGRLYLDMRYVEGKDLGTTLAEDGPLDPAHAVDILTQVAAALDSAHAGGLVHRDVKPSNILLSDPSFAYLTDFGVAVPVADTRMTSPGMVIGTLKYLSPEALSAESVDHRADIYALGCVLFEMLTGQEVFVVDGLAATMSAHLTRSPDRPSSRRPGVPTTLDDVVARALAKLPGERYQSAGEFAAAARSAVTDEPRPPSPPPRPVPVPVPLRPAALAPPAEPPTQIVRPPPAVDDPFAFDTWSYRVPTVDTTHPLPPARPRELPGPSIATERSRTRRWQPAPPAPVRLWLRPNYHIVGGPLLHGAPLPFLGNQAAVNLVRQRIQHSPGGALLVTGFTGAGKTTVVRRALAELRGWLLHTAPERVPLVEVWLSVANPVTPDQLMIKLIRNLCEEMQAGGVLDRIPRATREALETAYRRTSLSLRSLSKEGRDGKFELGGGDGLLPVALKPAISYTRTRSAEREEAFREYTLADAEHDFRRIVADLLPRVQSPPKHRGLFGRRRGARPPADPWTGRLVVVIDELDKLTADAAGSDCLESLLSGLKSVFTSTDLHFVFVAGADVLAMARAAERRGSSVWNGVFSGIPYLPGLRLGAAAALLDGILAERPPGRAFCNLCDYLEYRSRGLPRLLLNALNELVDFGPDGRPQLVVDEPDAQRIAFYAEVQRRLGPLWARARRPGPRSHPIDADRRRMAVHLIVEWALARGGGTFSLADFVTDTSETRPDPALVSDAEAATLLAELADDRIAVLESETAEAADRTRVDVASSPDRVYRVDRSLLAMQHDQVEAAELGHVGNERYELVDELRRGALARTYRAADRHTGRTVAVKVFDLPELAHDERARQRFQRELDLARRLEHPNLASTQDVVEEPDGRLALVSDFVEGRSLEDFLQAGRRSGRLAASVGRGLAELLGYLDDQGVARLDLKPSNVVVQADLRPVLLELGMARRIGEDDSPALTRTGVVIGTPRYFAPEQFYGASVDIRADLYALGLILYEIVSGQPARTGGLAEVMRAALERPVRADLLPCSPGLRHAIGTLVATDPARRCARPADVVELLSRVPEAWEPVPRW